MTNLITNSIAFLRNEKGTTAIEYALIASLIAVIIVTSVTLVGTNLNENFYQKIVNAFP